jgi:Domain of unknown function (DUF4832)
MSRMRGSASLVILVALAAFGRPARGAEVTVKPEATDEILVNPGMGWETFHQSSRQDRTLPPWLPSSVYYIRWGWKEVEPRPGAIDTHLLDETLKQAHEAGQKVAFRVMCCSSSRNAPYHPAWIKDVGGKELIADYDGTKLPIPDLDDPVTLGRHLDLIKRLGERYDGHPDLDHVDLGSVGWWGEWHLSGSRTNRMPVSENRKKVVDAYTAAFKKTPLVMLIGGGDDLKSATSQGTGWRADCLGDMGGFSSNWCHMRKGYPVWIKEAGIQNVWKTAPVAWETCWDMRKWVSEGWSLRYIFNYALALHGSYINNKSAPLPTGDDVRPEIERFLRRLGYRLVLKELSHDAAARPGGKLELRTAWQNVGSAPCYRPYRLAYRLSDGKGHDRVFPGAARVNRWMPGSVDLFTDAFFKEPPDLPPGEVNPVSDTIALPRDLPAGDYTLALAVVEGEASRPVVKLAIQGRASDGWYPLSKVVVGP